MHRRVWIVPACLVALMAGTVGGASAANLKSHVRGINRGGLDAGGLLAEAASRCGTIRNALDTLEGTNLIVLLELRADRPHQPPGLLWYIGTGHGTRYVQIVISAFVPRDEQIATLAHELQHALEIAESQGVTDQASLRELYRRIGDEVQDNVFETDLAREAYRQALADLNASAPRTDKR